MEGPGQQGSIPLSPPTSSSPHSRPPILEYTQSDPMSPAMPPNQSTHKRPTLSHTPSITQARTSTPQAPEPPPRDPPVVQLRALEKDEKVGDDVSVILLIGPTGAGKSNFIETLGPGTNGPDKIVNLAKAKLGPGTQDVVGYRMEHQHLNIYTTKPIILVDTPGLSNPRKSEMQVLLQIKKWRKNSGVKRVDRLIYMDRISDNRMTHSRKRSLELFKAFCGIQAAERAVVVTTMWDLMWNPRLKAHAEHRFKLLKDEYWNDFLHQGSRIDKFNNTFDAALDNLRALGKPLRVMGPAFAFEKEVALNDTEMGRQAFWLLAERYNKLDAYLQQVDQDIKQSAGMQNEELDRLLLHQKTGITQDLKHITEELQEYSPEYKVFRDQVYWELDLPGSPKWTTTINTTTHRPGGFKAKLEGQLVKLKDFASGGKSKPPSKVPSPYNPPVNLPSIHESIKHIAEVPKSVLLENPTFWQPHRQQAMMVTPQALNSRTWDSIFSDHSIPSPIKMENIANEDIVILLLGPTGSGKSSFLRAFFPQAGPLASFQSHRVQNSQTREVQAFRITVPKADYGLVFVDTPGFNAAHRLEFSTLNDIAHAIKDKSSLKLRFNGFIYFEPLGDLDLDARKTMLKIALEICGSENDDRVAVRDPPSFFANDKVAPPKQPVVKDHWETFLRRDDGKLDLERIWCFDLDLESSYQETRDAIKKYLWTLVREPHIRTTSQLQLQLEQGLPLEQTSCGIATKAYDAARGKV